MRERLLDAIAAKVGVDKVEIRRRNLIGKSAMPYTLGLETLGTHIVYDSGDYALLLDKALAAADWKKLQAQLRKRRAGRRKGRRRRGDVRGKERARAVRHRARRGRCPTARSRSITGVASIGQGVETVIAQICADALGVDYAGIRVIHGQTDRIDKGMGAFASRVTVMCGEATRLAAAKLRGKALRAAAELMQTERGRARHRRRRDRAHRRAAGPSMPLGRAGAQRCPGGLSAEDTFESTTWTIPTACTSPSCASIPTPAA